jgi:hypothetical protein
MNADKNTTVAAPAPLGVTLTIAIAATGLAWLCVRSLPRLDAGQITFVGVALGALWIGLLFDLRASPHAHPRGAKSQPVVSRPSGFPPAPSRLSHAPDRSRIAA